MTEDPHKVPWSGAVRGSRARPGARPGESLRALDGGGPETGSHRQRDEPRPVEDEPKPVEDGLSPQWNVSLPMACVLQVLDELDTGVLVCQTQGRVLLANHAARRELHSAETLKLDSGEWLVAVDHSSHKVLAQSLREAVQAQRRRLVRLEGGERRLVAMVVPLNTGPDGLPCAVVLLGRRQLSTDLTVQLLGSSYRLTAAERRVLAGLLAGQAIGEVAASHGVKVSTARSQAAALRAKMGVRRNHDLTLMVAELPPIAGALRSPELVGMVR